MTKYLVKWEYCPENTEKVIEKSLKRMEAIKQAPEKYAKYLFPPHHTGYCKGFSLVDVTDPAQITDTTTYYFPELAMQYIPIVSNEDMIKARMTQKQ